MLRLLRAVLFTGLLLTLLVPGPTASAQEEPSEEAVAAAYVDNIVLPTYTLLAQRLHELRSAIATLRQNPTDANLAAARSAWLAAREPWEWSESFLFGPVKNLSIDPALDTWPISEDNLKALLAGDTPLTPSSVAALEPEVKGYHSIEMILYGQGGTKTVSELTPRELEYAELVADEMARTGQTLVDAWTAGVDGEAPFRATVTSAGPGNAVYPSPSAVIEELLGGVVDLLNEVAEEKIGLPLDNRDPALAESWYSQTSIADYRNNVMGAWQAYTGGSVAGGAGPSLQALVVARDPDLDARISAGFQRSLAAIDAIPTPFEQSVLNAASSAQARAARNVIADLADLFDGEVFALLIGEREETAVSAGDQLAGIAGHVDQALAALANGDLAGAQAAYRAFDDAWYDVEPAVRSKSRDRYRELESVIAEVRSALLKPAQPDPGAAGAALTKLRSAIDSALPELR